MSAKKTLESLKQETTKSHSLRKTIFFRAYLAVAIAAFGVFAVLAKQTPYFGIDLATTLFIQTIQNPVLDWYLKLLTYMGNSFWAISITIGLILLLLSLGKRFYAYYFAITVIGLQIITVIIKFLVSRPRPDPELINQLAISYRDDSFPSGHVTFFIGTFGFLGYLAYAKMKSHKLRALIITVCTILVATIGISRIYVGAHWFSDTLGAYLIGSVWLYIMIYFFQKHPRNT